MGKETRIDWCDSTWNPVTGCLHGCEYCYARKIANRFGGYPTDTALHVLEHTQYVQHRNDEGTWNAEYKCAYPFSFAPTFHRYRLDEPQHWTKPRNIFVCSMADLFGDWVPDEWIKEVFEACARAPQHRYMFLTKNPQRYNDLYRYNLPYLENAMFGYTLDQSHTQQWFDHTQLINGEDVFVSIEPITEPLNTLSFKHILKCGWVIVGAETGNRKGKANPEKWWIDAIAKQCKSNFIPIFMKDSLRKLMGTDFKQQYPWADKREGAHKED